MTRPRTANSRRSTASAVDFRTQKVQAATFDAGVAAVVAIVVAPVHRTRADHFMSRFRVALHIVPRRGLLDPQGKAVADALQTLGFKSVGEVHVGRHLILDVDAKTATDAEKDVRAMCQRLLANPVTEDFEIAGVTAA